MAVLNSAVQNTSSISLFMVALAVLLADFAKYPLFNITYNLFFHPLRKFPGPKAWAATRLTYILSLVKGNLPTDTWKLHEKYGDVVRIAHDELSFASPEAFDDILATRQGNPPFPRNPIVYKGRPDQEADSISTVVSPAGHRRLRGVIAPAFTDRALAAQEPLIQKYVDFLIQRLTEEAISEKTGSCVVDLQDWYTHTTFDVLGDLGFGESFGCLENKALDPWIETIFSWIKAASFIASTRHFPLVEFALTKIIPKSLMKKQRDHFNFASDKIHRRMGHETMHEDFFTSILASKEGRSLSMKEIEETSHVIMLAGSDTTSTALCGITIYLLRDVDVLQKLNAEVRGAFNSVEEINLTSTKNLKCLNGVIQEGLRLCNPVPFLMSRLVPKGGDTVCGQWLPEGTIVIPHGRAVGLSPKYWARPLSFAPERWLEAPDRPTEFEADVREALKPFSTGPKNCIGRKLALAEIRLILTRLIWSFDLKGEGEPVDWFAQKAWFVIVKAPVMARLTPVRQ